MVRSPWSTSFPLRTPLPTLPRRLCSPASLVLRGRPTPYRRACDSDSSSARIRSSRRSNTLSCCNAPGLSILCQRKIFVDSITSRAMSLLCLYAQRAKFSLKNRIIPRGKHESAMMISREKKTPLRSNSISNQGRLGWFSGRSKGKKRPVGECKFFRAWPLCRHTEASLKRKPMIRGFSVLLPYRDYVLPSDAKRNRIQGRDPRRDEHFIVDIVFWTNC